MNSLLKKTMAMSEDRKGAAKEQAALVLSQEGLRVRIDLSQPHLVKLTNCLLRLIVNIILKVV
jgi:hypothetical protein